MESQGFTKALVPVLERGCLIGWAVLMAINTIIAGLALELLVFGVALSFNRIMLINESTVPLLFFGVIAVVFFPLIARLWDFGVDNLHFKDHERAFNNIVEPPESWSNSILALLDESADRTNEIVLLVRLIEEAPGPVERQDRRAEAKAWLKENRAKLTDEDLEFVKQNLGYLI
jgi:hypothetical protein